MTITGYAYGAPIALTAETNDARARLAELEDFHGRDTFAVCGECDSSRDWYGGVYECVTVFSSANDDILGESNCAVFAEEFGDITGVTIHSSQFGMSACVHLDTISQDDLATILDRIAGYLDYPVLDESDYSDREMTAWNDAMEWELRDIPEEFHAPISEYVSDCFYGYAEPGYVDPEWISRAIIALRIAPARRARTAPARYSHHSATVIEILAPSEDDDSGEWRELTRRYYR